MIVAIDGPAGSGKSTVAEGVARRRGYQLVDTGAMYRAVAFEALRRDVDLEDGAAVAELARQLDFEFRFDGDDNVVFCNGVRLDEQIRRNEVSRAASIVSAHPSVRKVLVQTQRGVGENRSSVLEGRDIGTVVFPDADVKVFITATPEERARRRAAQLREQGEEVRFEEVLSEIEQRDRRDTERETAPLKKADDAVEIVTDDMTVQEVIGRVDELVEKSVEKSDSGE